MEHEISQFEIPSRRLLATGIPQGLRTLTDVGKAKVAQTIFGKAKVLVIREHARNRHRFLLAAAITTAIVAIAAGQLSQSDEQPVVEDNSPPLNEKVQISAPTFRPEFVAPSISQSASEATRRTPPPVESRMAIRMEPAPQRPPALKSTAPAAAKAESPETVVTSKPKTGVVAASSNLPVKRSETTPPVESPAAIKPPVSEDAMPPEEHAEAGEQQPDIELADPLTESSEPASASSSIDNQAFNPVKPEN